MFVGSDQYWSASDRDLSSPTLYPLDSELALLLCTINGPMIDIFPIGSSRVTINIGRMGCSQIVIGGRQCSNTRIEFQSKRMVTKALAGLARAQWKLFSVRILYDRAVSALC